MAGETDTDKSLNANRVGLRPRRGSRTRGQGQALGKGDSGTQGGLTECRDHSHWATVVAAAAFNSFHFVFSVWVFSLFPPTLCASKLLTIFGFAFSLPHFPRCDFRG